MDRPASHSGRLAGRLAELVIDPDDPPPFQIVNPSGLAKLVLLCDHASNAIPTPLARLGLRPEQLDGHIAWDSGAAEVTRILSRRLDAPAVLSGYSRLVIDCNRKPGHETSIPESSDGVVIPGNQAVSPADAARRVEAVFHPYHHAVERMIDAVQARGSPPAIIAIHSFTPEMDGVRRPWQVSVLWDRDPRIATPLLAALRARGDLIVGDNQPYSGREHYGYSAEVHATAAGLPNGLIEIREDQIRDADGIARYADLLGDALAGVLADPELYRVENY
jgi:predicted N-formylglutamate amidohydrolase